MLPQLGLEHVLRLRLHRKYSCRLRLTTALANEGYDSAKSILATWIPLAADRKYFADFDADK